MTTDFQIYLVPLAELEDFFPNTLKILSEHNILFVGDLAATTVDELLALPGIGEKRILELMQHLKTVDVCIGEQT